MKNSSQKFTYENLKEAYNNLKSNEYKGIKGVYKVSSSQVSEGPNVGITIGTHGNEIAGLAALVNLTRDDQLESILQTGSITFVANNLKALDQFFESKSDEEKQRLMYVDHNMNRLPENILNLVDDKRYEIQRTLELYPVFKEFDAALDIHCTYGPSLPMIVEVKNGLEYLKKAPIPTVLTNMLSVQKGIPISGLYGGINNQNVPILGIEAGMMGNPLSFDNAAKITEAFLYNLGVISTATENLIDERRVYRVSKPILFPNSSYKYVRDFKSFDEIRQGQVLASGNGNDVASTQNGHILFPKHFKFDTDDNEAGFISDSAG